MLAGDMSVAVIVAMFAASLDVVGVVEMVCSVVLRMIVLAWL